MMGYITIFTISIHALREEGDSDGIAKNSSLLISIHALREEGDTLSFVASPFHARFLSTPSARRATICQFYPHRR